MSEPQLPKFPNAGDAISDPKPNTETLNLLAARRSTLAKNMTEPGPSEEEIDLLIKIGSRVPDHGKLFPWRFVVFQDDARLKFGNTLAARFAETHPEAEDVHIEFERSRFMRAPVVIAVISDTVENHKIPEWEQILSAGAVCQNMLIGAQALGYGAQWLTEWYAFDKVTKTALGLKPGERVAGFIYVGSSSAPLTERPRKAARVERWTG